MAPLGDRWHLADGTPAWNPLDLGSPSQARNPWSRSALGSRPLPDDAGRPRARRRLRDAAALALEHAADARPRRTGRARGDLHGLRWRARRDLRGHERRQRQRLPRPRSRDAARRSPPSASPAPRDRPHPRDGRRRLLARARRTACTSRAARAPTSETLWCLNLGPAGAVAFTLRWKVNVGNISGSPVLRNDRIYVGTDAGEVKSVRADDGIDVRTIALGDGPVQGFVFPDRASGDVYVSTDNKVWRLTDTGSGWTDHWPVGVPGAEPVAAAAAPGSDARLRGRRATAGSTRSRSPGGAVTSIALDYDPVVVRRRRAVLRPRLRPGARRQRARHLLRGRGSAAMRSQRC